MAEITLVVALLVAVPLTVAVVARSERSPNAAPATLVAAKRVLADGGITVYDCVASPDNARITCRAHGPDPGPGTCTFSPDGSVACHGGSDRTSWFATINRPGRLR